MLIPEMVGLFAILLVVVAIVGKMGGALIAGLASRFNKIETLGLGIGMIPRGEVVLVILSIGKGLGVIPDIIFSSVFLVLVVTVIITPILLTILLKNRKIPG